MDDDKQYTIQIKGTAYKFRPIPDEDLARIQLVFNMNASLPKTLKAITRLLKESVGGEQWDALTDRLIDKEITLDEMVSLPIKRLVERQVKDAKASADDV